MFREAPPTLPNSMLQSSRGALVRLERLSSRARTVLRVYGTRWSRRLLTLVSLTLVVGAGYVLWEFLRMHKVFEAPLVALLRAFNWGTDLEGMEAKARGPARLDRGYYELTRALRYLIAEGPFVNYMARFPIVRQRLGPAPQIDPETVQVRVRYEKEKDGGKRVLGATARFVLFTPEAGAAECLVQFDVRQVPRTEPSAAAAGLVECIFRVRELSIDLGEPQPLNLRVQEAFPQTLLWHAHALYEELRAKEDELRAKEEELAKTLYGKS